MSDLLWLRPLLVASCPVLHPSYFLLLVTLKYIARGRAGSYHKQLELMSLTILKYRGGWKLVISDECNRAINTT